MNFEKSVKENRATVSEAFKKVVESTQLGYQT